MVGAGNTGATMAAALLGSGRIPASPVRRSRYRSRSRSSPAAPRRRRRDRRPRTGVAGPVGRARPRVRPRAARRRRARRRAALERRRSRQGRRAAQGRGAARGGQGIRRQRRGPRLLRRRRRRDPHRRLHRQRRAEDGGRRAPGYAGWCSACSTSPSCASRPTAVKLRMLEAASGVAPTTPAARVSSASRRVRDLARLVVAQRRSSTRRAARDCVEADVVDRLKEAVAACRPRPTATAARSTATRSSGSSASGCGDPRGRRGRHHARLGFADDLDADCSR